MAGTWRALVLAAGLAAMACVAQRQWGFEERVVAQALQLFNSGRQGQPLSRLREVLPAPRSNSTFKTLVSFRVKETVCLSERQQQPEPQQCAFRDGGEERDCTGASFTRGPLRILMVDCNPGLERQQEGLREKRSAPSPEGAASEVDSSQLPPVARDLYEKAKFDIIANLLRNF
ncbi:hypothetical protein QTO34_007425 [Cnephaeus nilssonii]|uniref:Uncharacterized protein n=1 Tax=Cnephaeus nilssonii TaxID=3371016 RepID=A0AA40HKY6_CNENI|nr:hypothetical protein QTO34_007425 [Eptesicus nilssonii]